MPVVLLVTLLVLAGLAPSSTAATSSSTAGPPSSTADQPSSTVDALATDPSSPAGLAEEPGPLKEPATGLLDRDGVPPTAFSDQGVVDTFVVQAYWKDLQPEPGGPIVADNVVDRALAAARALSPPARVKLRLFAGIHAPDWAKRLDGEPFDVWDPYDRTAPTPAPRWWTPSFGAAYDDLQAKLAALYDDAPELAEVVISRCTTVWAEPFTRGATSAELRASLLAAGFTADADKQCIAESVTSHGVWTRTRSSMAFNPYHHVESATRWRYDEDFSESMMDHCRSVLGQRCVLENNSIRTPISTLGPLYARMYVKFRTLGPPVTYQTAVPGRYGHLTDGEAAAAGAPQAGGVLDWAVALGATAVELPADYTSRTPAGLAAYDRALDAAWTTPVEDPAPAGLSGAPPALAVVGQPYTGTYAPTGRPQPVTLVTAGALPAGLVLSRAGELSGTPTTRGRSTFTVTAVNGVGPPASTTTTIDVEAPPTVGGTPPPATLGRPYSWSLATTGQPVVTLASGALPPGLRLATTGLLSGTPTRTGRWTFAVTATNRAGQASAVVTVSVTGAPGLRIGDAAVAEGSSGSTTLLSFPVTLSRASAVSTSVRWRTVSGSATSPGDFAAASGTLVLPAGQLAGRVTVRLRADRLVEPDEVFTVVLGQPTGAVVLDGRAVGRIVDDD